MQWVQVRLWSDVILSARRGMLLLACLGVLPLTGQCLLALIKLDIMPVWDWTLTWVAKTTAAVSASGYLALAVGFLSLMVPRISFCPCAAFL